MFRDYSIGIYEKALPQEMNWGERFSAAQKAGYEFLELSVDETDYRLSRLDWGRNECRDFIQLQHDMGFRVPTLCLSGLKRYPLGSPDKGIRDAGLDIFVRAVRLASLLGIRVLQVAGYDTRDNEESSEETSMYFHKNLGTALIWAEKLGVTLAVENMGVTFMDSLVKIMKYVDFYRSSYLQVYADVGNLHAMKKDLLHEFTAARGHIAAVHIKDTLEGVYREIPFSKGNVNFQKVFSVIRESGYRGMLLLEMWNRPDVDNTLEIESARIFITDEMTRAGLK